MDLMFVVNDDLNEEVVVVDHGNLPRSTLQIQNSDSSRKSPESVNLSLAICGDSFYYSVANGLKQLKPDTEFTVKSLRNLCKDLVKYDQFLKNKIIEDARYPHGSSTRVLDDISDDEIWNAYLERIVYTSDDMNKMSRDNPHLYQTLSSLNYGNSLQAPIFGRPYIEGLMICKKYNVKLHIIEKCKITAEWQYYVIHVMDDKSVETNGSDTVHIVSKGNALFEPVLRNHRQCLTTSIRNYDVMIPLDNTIIHDNPKGKEVVDSLEKNLEKHSKHMVTLSRHGTKVTEKVKEFVKSFVFIYEKTLCEYYNRLENQIVKSGKWADLANNVMNSVKGVVEVIDTQHVKSSTIFGSIIIQNIITSCGKKHNRNELKKIMYQLYNFREDPSNVREALVRSGVEIFQKFESQFAQVTADGSWQRAMGKLAHDAVNRVLHYSRRSAEERLCDTFVTQGVVLGQSQVYKNTSTGLPHVNRGHTLQGKNSRSWNTAKLFEKTGLVITKYDGTADKYYKKKSTNSDKYGYRLLFDWESEDKLKLAEMLRKEYQEEKGRPREEYEYILNPDEVEHLKDLLLSELNDTDPKLMEQRIVQMFQEEVQQVKQNSEEYFKELEMYIDSHFDELLVYIENNQNEIKEMSVEVVRYFQEANKKSEEIAVAVEDGRKENRANFEQLNQKLDIFIKVNKRKDVKPTWFDVRESVQSFTGRQEQLDQIVASIKKGVTVISGLGGVGKSELAVKYARSYYTQEDSVIWINAETYETAKDSFRRLLKSLGLKTTDQDGDEKSVGLMARDVYDHFGSRLNLLIFDNAEKHSIIKEFLPHRARGYHVLITSQIRDFFSDMEYGKVELGILPEDNATVFVKRALKINDTLQDKETKELVETLGRLPLALQHAVAYIKESGFANNIGKYVELYKKSKHEIQSFLTREGLNTYDKTIFLTFKASIDKVDQEESGKLAGEILNMIAYFASDNIPKETLLRLVEERVDEPDANMRIMRAHGMLERAMSLLSRYSITNEQATTKQVSIHRLVQQVIRLQLGNENEEDVLEKTLHLLGEYMLNRESVENYMPHIISVWNYAHKYEKLIEIFITNNVGGQDAYTTHFHSVAGSSSYEVVEAIIRKIDPKKLADVINGKDKEKRTPLHNASFSGKSRVVHLLIDNGANVNAEKKFEWTPLHLASDNGHTEVVNVLLEKGANVNAETGYKFTPLHLAAREGHAEIVKCLLEKEIDINAQTKFKFTPLHLAAENDHLKVVEYLLNKGVSVNAVTEYKFTPLHLAARKGHLGVVRALVGKMAEIDALDNGNFTPLHLAAQNGHLEVVKVLIENRANINTRTTKGNTPLHLAAHCNHLPVVALLIEKNANVNIENDEGKTALNLANETEVRDYIRLQTFNRRQGTAGIKGQLYEINLLMLFLLQGARKKGRFYLATNVEEAGDFDDVVFKYESGPGNSRIVFVQAKHRENLEKDKVTFEQLYSESEKGDFNLKKYFNSFRKIKRQFLEGRNDKIFGSKFEGVDFIIYTNARDSFNKHEESFEKVNLEPDSIFNVSEKSSVYYKLVTSGASNEKKINTLLYSSDCRRLARDLAQCIYSGEGLRVNEAMVRNYHVPLAREVIQKNEGDTEGYFRETFLNTDSQFRYAVFDELRKFCEFASLSDDELRGKLQNKSIKLSENFGNLNARKGKYPEDLPNDLVSVDDVKEFLSMLKLFVEQPSEEELSLALKLKIQELYKVPQQDIDTVFSDIQNKVLEWWKKGNNFLTESNKIFQEATRISIQFDVREPVNVFTGRISELEKLSEILEDCGEAVISQIASVTGLGGVGKSELARKYISEHSKKYDDNIVWVNAENYLTITESFRRLAQDKLRISTVKENGEEKDIKVIVEDVYNFFGTRQRRSLFVFDNAGKYKAARETEGIFEFLPSNSHNLLSTVKPSVLITSRDKEWGEIRSLSLGVFTEEEAVSFVRRALQIKYGSQENEIMSLCETLHRLPLALQQAVSFINKENQGKWRNEKFTINNYLELFQERANELLDSASDEGFDRYTETVFTTWHITIEKIKQKKMRGGEQALDILDVVAYLAADKIPIDEIFSNLISDEEIRHSAVELLDQYSMANLESGKLSIHRLVQQVTRLEVEAQGKHEKVIQKTSKLLRERYFDIRDVVRDFSKRRELLSHFETFLSHIDNWQEKDPSKNQLIKTKYLEDLLILTSEGYSGLGNPRRQKELLERALRILEEYDGSESLKLALVLTNLSCTYGSLGDPWKERELAERALSIILKTRASPENFKISEVVLNLGNAYEDLGDHEKKKKLLEWALVIEEECHGPESIGVSELLASVSSSYGNLGDFRKAKELLERAVLIMEKYYGRDDFRVAVLLTNLGNVYGALGELVKRKELLERALRIEENHYGGDHFNVAVALGSLGFTYRDLGDFRKAKELLERALDIDEKHYGRDHFKTAIILLNLGITYIDLEDFHKGKELLERALIIQEKHYGPEYFEVARILVNLGNAYGALNEFNKQKDLLEKALKIFENHYGSDNVEVAKTLLNLGVVYGSLGDDEKGKEFLVLALSILENHYGSEHFEVSTVLTNLGNAYISSGDFLTAKDLLLRSLAIKEKHFGPTHIKLALTLIQLGNTYRKLGDVQKGKECLERAVEIKEKQYGPEHFEVALVLSVLSNVHGELGERQKQKEFAERALLIFEQHYGPDDIKVSHFLINLGNTYRELRYFQKAKDVLERALDIREKEYGSEHLEVGIPLVNLGNAYGDLGEHNKKKELLERALPIFERQYGSEHIVIAQTLKNLGVVYLSLRDFQKAKELIECALVIEEKCYGPEYFEIAKTLGNLSVVYGALRVHETQVKLLERALKIEENHYGREHVQLSATLGNLGNAYGELGDFQKALEFLERSLGIEEKRHGIEHIALAVTLQNMCTTYGYTGDNEKKILVLERVLRIFEKHYGTEHIALVRKLVDLSNSYGELGEFHKAKEFLKRALEIKEKHYGPLNFELAETLLQLCNIYERLCDHEEIITLLERTTIIFEKHYGAQHIAVASTLDPLGNAYGDLGNFHKAKELQERAIKIKENHYGPNNFELAIPLLNLGTSYGALGDHKKRKEMLERSCAIFEEHKHPIGTELRRELAEIGTLHFACRTGDLDMVKELLAEGANVLARNEHDTILHKAVSGGNVEVVTLILNQIRNQYPKEANDHINAKDAEGDTPLMWAAQKGKCDIGQLLIINGADLNVKNNVGETALHWATKGGYHEFVVLLLDNKADSSMKSKDGKTPLDVAREKVDLEPENEKFRTISSLLSREPTPSKTSFMIRKFFTKE